jgi:cystathionine beta-lyase
MGSVAVSTPAKVQALEHCILEFGWSVAPDDAYQMLRGLRTLPTRLARHEASALEVAAWLAERPEVAKVLYPALPGAPGHALWKRDYAGAAGLFAVVMRPGSDRAVAAFLDTLKLFGLGFSWGGFESLALNGDPQFDVRRFKPGYGGPVIRLNIGLEDPADLIVDLGHGLKAYAKSA